MHSTFTFIYIYIHALVHILVVAQQSMWCSQVDGLFHSNIRHVDSIHVIEPLNPMLLSPVTFAQVFLLFYKNTCYIVRHISFYFYCLIFLFDLDLGYIHSLPLKLAFFYSLSRFSSFIFSLCFWIDNAPFSCSVKAVESRSCFCFLDGDLQLSCQLDKVRKSFPNYPLHFHPAFHSYYSSHFLFLLLVFFFFPILSNSLPFLHVPNLAPFLTTFRFRPSFFPPW